MSFSNYTGLQEEIKSFLWDRTDVSARIPSFIQLAESEMRRLLRTQQTVKRQSYNLTSGTASVPCDEMQIMAVQLQLDSPNAGTVDLDYATPEQMAQWNFVSQARPRFYTVENETLRFAPVPDKAYAVTVIYTAYFTPLSATNRTNWVLEKHPDIYLSGALKWAKRWLIDQDMDWDTPFYAGIEATNRDQPTRQANSRLRTDDVAVMNRRGRYNVYTDSYGGTY